MHIRLESRIAALVSRVLATAAACAGFHVAIATLQAQTIVVGTASAPSQNWVDIDIEFAHGGTPVASLQFDLSFSAGLSYTSVQIGDAASAAGKLVGDNSITPPPEICTSCAGVRILIYGVNQTAIGSGKLVTIRFTSTKGGFFPLHIYGIVAADPDANPVICPGSDGSVTLLKRRPGQITSS